MSKKGVAKSLGLTLLGIVLFLVKIPGQGQSVFNLIVSTIENILEPVNAWVLFIFIGVSLFGTICGTCLHAPFITKNERLANCFVDKKMQLVTLLVAFFVIVSYLFLPFDIINTESDALVTMCANMVVFMIVAKLISAAVKRLRLLGDAGSIPAPGHETAAESSRFGGYQYADRYVRQCNRSRGYGD